MKYYKLLIIIMVLIITGCTKEYQLYIDDNKITEKFHMEIESGNKNSHILDGDFYPLHNDFDHKFKKELKEKNGNKVLDIEYSYSLTDFINANSFNQCFDERQIINDDKYYTIELSKPNGCMFNEDYVINIITDNKVVENNAQEVKGNKYIWDVSNNNKDNFKLVMKVQKGTTKSMSERYNYIAYIIVGAIIIGILVFAVFTIRKKKNTNKI